MRTVAFPLLAIPIVLLGFMLHHACASSNQVAIPSPPASLDAHAPSLMPSRRPTNGPLTLESTNTIGPAATIPRLPVYVIPEALVVQTPQGAIVFAAQHHVEELARKWGGTRVTNVVFYNRP